MKNFFTKDRLYKILLIVSILTVALIGIRTLGALSSNLYSTLGGALRSVVLPFAIAFLLSFLLRPLARLIEEKTNLSTNISVIISMVIGILFVIGILSITMIFIVSQLVTVTVKLIDLLDNETFRSLIQSVITFVEQNINMDSFEDAFNRFQSIGITPETVFGLFGALLGGIRSVASTFVNVGFVIIMTPVFMFYLIRDREQVFNGILNAFPKKSQKHIKELGQRSDGVIRGYFVGWGFVMLFITIFFMITYSILSFFVPGFNIGYAILFALIMGVFSIIPYLGVWISMAMPIVLFLTLHFESADPGLTYIIAIAMILVLNIVEEIIESTLVQPNVYSKQVRIHPLAVLSSFIFFGAIFGLVGVILAVPIAGTIKVTIQYFRSLNQDETNDQKPSKTKEKENQKDKHKKTQESTT